jgi:hypothetical protein
MEGGSLVLSNDVTQSDEAVTELGDTGRVLLAELEDAHAAKADAEARIERVRAAIETLLTQAGATEGRVNGQPVITWRPVVSKRFDASRAKRFLTEDQIAACMVTSESRAFRRVTQ